MIAARRGTTVERIEQFERKYSIELPDDYRDFLRTTNGGHVIESAVHVDHVGKVLIDSMYGLDIDLSIDLESVNDEFRDEVPSEMIIIGDDPGGAFFLLDTSREDCLYYYDHGHTLELSNASRNTYRVAIDLRTFISAIHE